MTPPVLSVIGCLFGATAIIFGAFGAHLLKKYLTPELLQSFETGVRYQMYHAITMLVLGLNLSLNTSLERITAWFFCIGTFLFSFSIYALCISTITGKKLKILGPVTPLGGLILLLGWIFLISVLLN